MSNKVAIFENEQFGKVRTITKQGEPWFVLADLCKALDLSNTTKVAQRLEEDERSNFKLGRQGYATIVNESGMYAVILRSDKPQAKAFRKWVTSEVLPSIRKTGAYNIDEYRRQRAENAKMRAETARINANVRQAKLLMRIEKETNPKQMEELENSVWEVVKSAMLCATLFTDIKKNTQEIKRLTE